VPTERNKDAFPTEYHREEHISTTSKHIEYSEPDILKKDNR